MPENEVQIVISAIDRASGVVAQATQATKRELDQLTTATRTQETQLVRYDTQLRQTARGVRALALPLVTELSPAFGATTSRMVSTMAVAATLGTGWAALGIAASGLAGILVGEVITALRKSSDAQERWNRALATKSVESATAEVAKYGKEIEAAEQRLQRLSAQFDRSAQSLRIGTQQELADLRRSQSERVRQIEGIPAKQALESQRSGERKITIETELAVARAREEINLRAAERRTEILQAAEKADEEVRNLAGAAELAAMGQFNEELVKLAAEREGQLKAIRDAAAAADLEAINREGEAELAAMGQFNEELVKIGAERAQALAQGLDFDRQRIAILSQQQGLTESQRTALELQAIELERVVKLEEARAVPEKESLANLEAHVLTVNTLQRELERTDFVAGLNRGFQDSLEDLESWGRAGQLVVRDFTFTAQRFFSDSLFLPIEKGWKRALEEVPRQFAMSTLRILTDLVGRIATAQLLRGLGAQSLAGLVTTGLLASAPGAAQAVVLAPGQALPAGFAAISTTAAGGTVAVPAGGGGTGLPLLPLGVLPQPSFLSNFLSTPLFAASFGAGSVAIPPAGITGVELLSSTPGVIPATSLPAFTLGQALGVAAGAAGLGLTVFSALQQPPSVLNFATSAISGALSGALIGAQFGFGPAGAIAGGLIGGIASLFGRGRRPSREPQEIARGQAASNADVARIQAATTPLELAAAVRTATHQAYGGPAGRGTNPSTAGFAVFVAGAQFFFGPVNSGQVFPGALERFAELIVAQPETFQARIQLGVNEGAKAQINQALEQAVQAKASDLQRQRVAAEREKVQALLDEVRASLESVTPEQGRRVLAARLRAEAERLRQAQLPELAERLEKEARRLDEEFERLLSTAAQRIPIAFEEPLETIGPGITLRRTILTAAQRELARGRDLFTLPESLIRVMADPEIAEALLRALADVDRDRRLGILSREVF